GVFAPSAFGRRQPRDLQTWQCVATRAAVELVARDYFRHTTYTFPRTDFLVNETLPNPGL
ncbi:MAG TPA: hypothetical protein VK864_11035, partial [Longimicrobiales bacterium]|nr:hypothetical protein [Longimicrobiales bacterium]